MKHLFDPTTLSLIVWRASRRISILFFALFSLLACVSPELSAQQSNVKSDLTHTPTVDSANSYSGGPVSTPTAPPTAPPAPTLTASPTEPTAPIPTAPSPAPTLTASAVEPTVTVQRTQQFGVRNPQGLPLAWFPSRHFEVGIGSGAFHAPNEEEHLIYVVTDNGPRHKCGQMSDKLGIAKAQLCPDDKKAQIAFVPTIYHLSLNQDGTADVLEAIPVPHELGSPIAGFDNLRRISKSDEQQNEQLAEQLDIEALVRLSDGSFWLAEEKTPSLLHVTTEGQILERLGPNTELEALSAASYTVEAVLPALLSALYDQKGIEALALSPDEQYLYFTTQAPLAHPSDTSSKESRQLRIFKFDWQRQQVVATFLYLLDAADEYHTTDKQESVVVTAMAAARLDQLLLVERAKIQTRIYLVDLASAPPLDALYGDAAIRPTLEESSLDEIKAQGIQPLAKQLLAELATLDTPKIEGLAIMNPNTLILVNDTDFGKEGLDKPIIKLVLPQPITSDQ